MFLGCQNLNGDQDIPPNMSPNDYYTLNTSKRDWDLQVSCEYYLHMPYMCQELDF